MIGIDISAPMIARAKERMTNRRYPYVKQLLQMDAANLSFADQCFDCVVGQFVITLVDNPERVLSECRAGAKAGRTNHPGESSLFGNGSCRSYRTLGFTLCATARVAAGIPPCTSTRLGGKAWRY
jgi:SAM-dependent methyltransferase